jgi:hypothetical protein
VSALACDQLMLLTQTLDERVSQPCWIRFTCVLQSSPDALQGSTPQSVTKPLHGSLCQIERSIQGRERSVKRPRIAGDGVELVGTAL